MLEKVIKNDDRTTADEGGGTEEYANKCITFKVPISSARVRDAEK